MGPHSITPGIRVPTVSVERGDITKSLARGRAGRGSPDVEELDVDAIVNAANPMMLGGGGVDGAIHDAAGPELLAACRQVPAVGGIRCPFGEARITPGFALPARYVIHTVGPIYRRDPEPEATLRSAYRACLGLARDHGLRSLAFPGISTGSYGFPLEPAARIALTTACDDWGSVARIRFVLFTKQVFDGFAQIAAELGLEVLE